MKKVIGLTVLVALVVIGMFLFSSNNDTTKSKFDKAPEFSLEDYDGNIVSSNYSLKEITVVNAWATWCPFCVDELPDFALLQEEFSNEIEVVAIDREESLKKAKEFSDEIGVTGRMTMLLDPKDSFYQSIGGFSMPETIFVDKEGNILLHKRGPLRFEEMRQIVEEMLLEAR